MIKQEGVLKENTPQATSLGTQVAGGHSGSRPGADAWPGHAAPPTQGATWNPLAYVRNHVKLKHLALASKIKEDKKRRMPLC